MSVSDTGPVRLEAGLTRLSGSPEAARTLLLLPHSGCSAAAMLPIAQHVDRDLLVLGVDYPGHGRRVDEPFADDMQTLGAGIADAVSDALDYPLVVFGHSFGSLVAFETVRRLEEQGTRVDLLIASSCVDPHRMAAQERSVHLVSDEALLNLLVERGGMSEELMANADVLEVLLPIIRADTRLGELHRPDPAARLRTPVLAIGGSDDPTVSRQDLAGWGDVTTAGADVMFLPGDHFHLLEHPAGLAALLSRQARSAAGGVRR